MSRQPVRFPPQVGASQGTLLCCNVGTRSRVIPHQHCGKKGRRAYRRTQRLHTRCKTRRTLVCGLFSIDEACVHAPSIDTRTQQRKDRTRTDTRRKPKKHRMLGVV